MLSDAIGDSVSSSCHTSRRECRISIDALLASSSGASFVATEMCFSST